jgi:hypothetical protein
LYWLFMKHVDMVNSLAKIKVELVNLFLEKLNIVSRWTMRASLLTI